MSKLDKYRCCFTFFFFKALFSPIFKGEKNIHWGEKRKASQLRPQAGPSDVLHHCSGTKLFLGLKKAEGTEDMPACLPPTGKFSERSTATQIRPATGSMIFTFHNEAKHVIVIFRRQMVCLQKMRGHRAGAIWVRAAAHSTEKLFLHIQLCRGLPWWPWAPQSHLLAKGKAADASGVFPKLVWSLL